MTTGRAASVLGGDDLAAGMPLTSVAGPPRIAVLSALLSGNFFRSVMTGVLEAATTAGLGVIAVQTLDPTHAAAGMDHAFRHVDWRLAAAQIAGAIVLVDSAPDDYVASLVRHGRPVVCVAEPHGTLACPVVAADNRGGVAAAMAHLLAHGHERIAFVGNLAQCDIRERYAAYRDALRDRGIAERPELVITIPDNLASGGRRAGEQLLAAGLPSTAVMAATDDNALGLIAVLQEAGLSLPGDQAVVGFDDLEAAAASEPALASVHQDPALLGATAARLLAAGVAGRGVLPGRYRLPTSFVPRASCGCAPCTARPPETARGGPSDMGERLRRRLAETLRCSSPAGAHAMPAATALDALAAFVERPECADAGSLSALVESFALAPAQFERVEAIVDAARACAEMAGDAGVGRAARERLLTDLSLAFSRRLHTASARAEARLAESLRDEYRLSLDLLRHDHADPRRLAFLARTPVRAACLGLWAPDDPRHEELELVGAYARAGTAASAPGARIDVRSFPPASLVAEADGEAGELTIVVPVRGEASDWGMLAVVARLDDAAVIMRDFYFQCAVLLCAALDQEHLLQSLRHQRVELESQRNELSARQVALEEKQEELRRSEQRYALAATAASDGLWDLDLERKEIYLSERCRQLLGDHSGEPGTRPEALFSRVHPEDRPAFDRAVEDCVQGRATVLLSEHRLRDDTGQYRWMRCRALAVPGAPERARRLVGSLTDITPQRQLEQRLRTQALHDALTGLPNRTLVVERLEAMQRRAAEGGTRVAAMFIDLDNFKAVNDSLGHGAGDELLVAVAGRLSHAVRPRDLVGRLGGDEFVVLVEESVGQERASLVAERVREALRAPFALQGRELLVSASIGIAASLAGSSGDLLRDADVAMYEAKAAGKSRSVIFAPDMHERARARLRLEMDLSRAITGGELRVHYQPVVDLASRAVLGFEALVRWEHPDRGLLSPAEFLPVAEASGRLVLDLGRFVLVEACRAAAGWQIAGRELGVSVNVAAHQLDSDEFVADVATALATAPLPAHLLVLEIPEEVAVRREPAQLARRVAELKALGVRIAIDHFGTGYGVLAHLRQMSIDAVKIDRSFISAVADSPGDRAVVETLVCLGRTLDVDVVAEGIEQEKQCAALWDAGCGSAQGYLFASPLQAHEIDRYLATARAEEDARRAEADQRLGRRRVSGPAHERKGRS